MRTYVSLAAILMAGSLALAGCVGHTHTERIVEKEPSGSSTTVVR
jgi:hypothetical protein